MGRKVRTQKEFHKLVAYIYKRYKREQKLADQRINDRYANIQYLLSQSRSYD